MRLPQISSCNLVIKMYPTISVILTSFNDGDYLDRIFEDLSKQDFDKSSYEVLFLEAGDYPKERALKYFKVSTPVLRYWAIPGFPRSKALNFLVSHAKGELIVRLDARSHIEPDYLTKIYTLSFEKNVANVGGAQISFGETNNQKMIALLMSHPLAFGKAEFRRTGYIGPVSSLYLGAFRRSLMLEQPWFDENIPLISEDSDLNYRINKSGRQVVLDSTITVKYYARESLSSFYKLCYNYGTGRALFFIKHRQFMALRQAALPTAFILLVLLLILSFIFDIAFAALGVMILCYVLAIVISSFILGKGKLSNSTFYIAGFYGCHIYWLMGFLRGIRVYKTL